MTKRRLRKRLFLFTCMLMTGMSSGCVSAQEQSFSFADVADYEFYFSSGVGAWYTVLYIHEDGTFDGFYRDSDMGASKEEYPKGTVYYSEFSGSFTEPVKADDTAWVFQIDSIEYPLGSGEEIKDGFYYNYSVAYGLDGAEDLYMYLPGTELAKLPEAYRSWVGYYDLENTSETVLPFYGLYNAAEECGFSSYRNETLDAGEKAAQEIAGAEEKEAALEEAFQNAGTQAELNELSYEIYTAWDDALNAIWGILKENLDEASMKTLTQEELAWIDKKEAEAAEAGAEYEGGSIYSMIVNQRAAELTKIRAYELVEYLQ